MLYLDCAATTPPYEEVITAVAEVMRKHFGNPSSIHRMGVEAERLLHKSREAIARLIDASADEILFTSGGTESNNLAIKGVAWQYRQRGRHLITTQVEHPSVLEVFRELEADGFRVTYLPVDTAGRVELDALQAALCEETILVSVMHVNNEVGAVQPIADIGSLLAGFPKALFHVDAVQSIGKLPFSPRRLGVHLCSASAHKFGGPRGAGFVYRRSGLRLRPLLAGGGQEFGLRSGTENVPLIVGMAKALRLSAEDMPAKLERKYRLRSLLTEGIASIAGLRVTGSGQEAEMAPHLVHFTFPGMRAEVVVHALEQQGIYISTKSACASGAHDPSHVLLAMQYSAEHASSGLRVSYSDAHSEEDARRFVTALRHVVEELAPSMRTSAFRRRR